MVMISIADPQLFEGYRQLLLKVCATGFKKEGLDADPLKIIRVFYGACKKAQDPATSDMALDQSLQAFALSCGGLEDMIEDELVRLDEAAKSSK